MRARGIPNYTRHAQVFPSLFPRGLVLDEISVTFAASKGGCYGSGVMFRFLDFSSGAGHPSTGMSVVGWDDGLANLLDDRIQAVLADLHKAARRRNRGGRADLGATPEQVVAALEKHGIRPSKAQQKKMAS